MIRLSFSLLVILIMMGCGSKDPAPPADTIDALTGTTWVRYGFKSPVSGKEIYYYMTFQKNLKVDAYVMYNKTERSPDNSELASYTHDGMGSFPGSGKLLIALKIGMVSAETSGNKLTLQFSSGDQIYIKE